MKIIHLYLKNTDDMKEIVGFKKAEFKAMVVQDDNGSLEYRGVNWRIVFTYRCCN